MRRREFIALLGSAVVVWPLAARAQAMIPPTGAFRNRRDGRSMLPVLGHCEFHPDHGHVAQRFAKNSIDFSVLRGSCAAPFRPPSPALLWLLRSSEFRLISWHRARSMLLTRTIRTTGANAWRKCR